MLWAGLRPNEALRLKWENVNVEGGYIDVLSDNKRKPGRKVPLHAGLRGVLEKTPQASAYVSPYRDSKYASRSMKRLEARTGVKCNPYKMRKTFCSTLVRLGVDPVFVAKIMGHSSVQTSFNYYLDLKDEQLHQAISKINYAPKVPVLT
jgi:integrase